jgi:streptothricin acetyltransferase
VIIRMTHFNMSDFNKSNESFSVMGRIVPTYEDGIWSYTEELFKEQYSKQYENDDIDASYIDDNDKAVYFYYHEGSCIGQIRLHIHWNGYALIEDIAVSKNMRKSGVGTALLNKAAAWARDNNLIGLVLETQDINLVACRFYAKNNYKIGAVDTMLYAKFPTANEKAVYWYNKF